ncbi:hypothetical protein AK812_SmicGene44482 [Symbiodinium microadriaticum]|uniref:Uncharacterized protein n=1 Tax=Symbiodinium microadriaticum TaxID=2951 RepID=A0A1Q9BYD1_SYMMI|nr:hypothetical protein AK812_SmicGene44482 [Symbiodinium microadriaticum]
MPMSLVLLQISLAASFRGITYAASLVEVVATDEEPEAQVPATKPVVEGAPPGVPAALAPEPVPAPSSEVGPASADLGARPQIVHVH